MSSSLESQLSYARKMFLRAYRHIPSLPGLFHVPDEYEAIVQDVQARSRELSKLLRSAIASRGPDDDLTQELLLAEGATAFAETMSGFRCTDADGIHPRLHQYLSTSDAHQLERINLELGKLARRTPPSPPTSCSALVRLKSRLGGLTIIRHVRRMVEYRRMAQRGHLIVTRQEFLAHATGRAFLRYIDAVCPEAANDPCR